VEFVLLVGLYVDWAIVALKTSTPVELSVMVASRSAAAHQLRQDKHQDMRQKTQSCFIRDSDSSPQTEVARVCVLSHLL
jgi:cobalamin biosynthesis protein CobD/CbiB